MATKYANDTATKIIDIIDDFIQIPLDGRIDKIKERLSEFIDNEGLFQADAKLNPEDAYLKKIDGIKDRIVDGINKLILEI